MGSALIRRLWQEILRDYSAMGSLTLLTFFSLAVGFWNRRLCLALLAAIFAVELLGSAVKLLAHRMRPDRQTYTGTLEKIDAGSFPSIHSGRIASVAVLVCSQLPVLPWAPLALLTVAAVGTSRVLLKRHYISDVVAGIALGFAVGFLLAALMAPTSVQ